MTYPPHWTGNLLINFLRISFLGFCGDGRQVRLVSFFVSSLFVPAAEKAIVVAWNFLVRPEISRFFFNSSFLKQK
jgi:hypothetical protein